MTLRTACYLVLVIGAGLILVDGLSRTRPAVAKPPIEDIWLAGGDLPHPVKIPNEELQNRGARRGEFFTARSYSSAEGLGIGYDLLIGEDRAAAFQNLRPDETYLTYYPRASALGVVRYWQPLTPVYSTHPQDRKHTGWNDASGGIFELIPRYVALAKAGLIGERPTFSEAVAASITLLGVQVAVLDEGSLSNGTPLTAQDAKTLAASLGSLAPVERNIDQRLLPGPFQLEVRPFSRLQVRFGTGDGPEGLLFIFAPPGTLTESGLLLPQIARSSSADQPGSPDSQGSSATAYRTTAAIDALLERYGTKASQIGGPVGSADPPAQDAPPRRAESGRTAPPAALGLAIVLILGIAGAALWRRQQALPHR